MQWLTPTIGSPRTEAKALAAVAATLRQGPRPGPMENATSSTSPGPTPAFSIALDITSAATSAWWLAASRGWSPPDGGRNMSISLARTSQPESTMPTPSVCAVPSMPIVIKASPPPPDAGIPIYPCERPGGAPARLAGIFGGQNL